MSKHMAGQAPKTRGSRRVNLVEVSATKLMPIIAARVGGCVSLGQGVPSFATPPHVVEAVSRTLREDPASGKYSLQPGMPALRKAIASVLDREKGLRYSPESEIAVTVGAMEALLCAILAFVDRGDEVILPAPCYASHIEQVQLAEGVPVFASLRRADWSLDAEAVRRAITPRTKAIVLCSPGNPTGTVFDEADMAAVCELAMAHDLLVISDETYDYVTYGRPMPTSPATYPGMRERTVVINSFSKKYALTGWRVGYMAAAEQLMADLLKIHDASAICAPTPAQHAALAALSGPQDVVDEMRLALERRRDLCCRRLHELRDYFDYVAPGGAFYIMARYKFTHAPSMEVATRLIEEARVITIPGGSFGPGGEGHLRLSFGGEESEIEEAFARIGRWVKAKA
ncbi:aspartate/tyrosine/aromatic aminotransferase [Desulfocurvibacter africanus PCS]|uniref:Aminotransferase n=1 Tax=Desulfocurvibacter africanus PCS TaxID=1262666 RepID=M5Q3E2_DESAF|nr:aminotransferase class I/II-fold pyridoxal phosphate-dependent enzyme [Desulfocurvibacter africanus]EMG38293.1 aspartate/tyrosine/aromatic aminotransferase [Desulfocurvibacter africanus PCS]